MTEVLPNLFALGTPLVRCYLLREPARLTLIDTGLWAERWGIAGALRRVGAGDPSIEIHVLLTHGHLDHAGNLHWLRDRFPDLKIHAHPDEQPHLDGTYPYKNKARVCGALEAVGRRLFRYRPVQIDYPLADGDQLPNFGGIQVVHLPGHTAGHCGFYSHAHDLLICGDLFACYGAEPRLPPGILNSQPHQLAATLQRALDLDPLGMLPMHCSLLEPRELATRFRERFGACRRR